MTTYLELVETETENLKENHFQSKLQLTLKQLSFTYALFCAQPQTLPKVSTSGKIFPSSPYFYVSYATKIKADASQYDNNLNIKMSIKYKYSLGLKYILNCVSFYFCKGSSINHVDNFLDIFLPPSFLWTILLNEAYAVIRTFGKPLPPLHVHMVYE